MNKRLYGMTSLPPVRQITTPGHSVFLSGKRSPVAGTAVCCRECGASRVTLRRMLDESWICVACWEKKF